MKLRILAAFLVAVVVVMLASRLGWLGGWLPGARPVSLLALVPEAPTPNVARRTKALSDLKIAQARIEDAKLALAALNTQVTTSDSEEVRSRVSDHAAELSLQLSRHYAWLGVTHQMLGQNEDALAAFQEATNTAPENKALWFSLGSALSMLDREQEAEDAFRKGMEAPNSDPALLAMAAAHYLQSAKYAQVKPFIIAQDESVHPLHQAYGAIRGILAAKAQGQDASDYAEMIVRINAVPQRFWPQPLFDYVQGKATEAEVAESVIGPNGNANLDRLCEALYYIGLAHEIDGDWGTALAYYQGVLATGISDYTEYHGAELGLRRIENRANADRN